MAIPAFKSDSSDASHRVYRKIRLRPQRPDIASVIRAELATSDVVARILASRGFDPSAELKNFLNPTLRDGLPDPSALKNVEAACKQILACKEAGKAIAVCCDFDVDGLSGGSIVHSLLTEIGISSKVFVPDRFTDGYGLNERMVREIGAAGYGLMITVDYGTTNVKELTIAGELGVPTIVIDHHHTAGKVPPCDIFINPHQEGCGFAGKTACAAGLAWYLVLAMKRVSGLPIDAKRYLDLACLGTICDMVPLVGLNRVIAKRGLEVLHSTKRPGLQSMKNLIGVKGIIGCSDVSFGIGPRLNAAGRIVHGDVVVELLTTEDSVRADKVARQLNDLNAERQEIENTVKLDAIRMIEEQGGPGQGLVVWNEEFHTGVIGIVAQRLVETYYRPSAVMGMDTPGIFKGSVRGIRGFSVVEALGAVSSHLIKFGGHEGAGGFSIQEEKLQAFKEAFILECEKRLATLETVPYAEADTEVGLDEITVPLVDELKGLAPFGMGNGAPALLVRNLRVAEVKLLKSAHMKVMLSDGKRFISGLMWRQTSHPAIAPNSMVDIVCRPEVNAWNGNIELMANLQAVDVAR